MSGILQLPCLGRHFGLGTLYDYRQDKVIPGISLWNNETLKKIRQTENRTRSKFDVIASDTLEAKTTHLGIDGGLKLSVLCDLVKVEGSATYLYNRVSSRNQVRVSLKYSSTTDFEELTMEQITGIEHQEVFHQGMATHVAIGVQYGANCVFVFDRELKTHENRDKAEGKLKAMVDIIPKTEISGSANVDLDMKKDDNYENFRCNFHGDFSLDCIPTTFDEAVKVCKELPKIIAKSKPVPMTVWLCPLQTLNCTENRVLRSIRVNAVNDIQKLLQNLDDLQVECSDFCHFDSMVKKLPIMGEQIKEFCDLVYQHECNVKDEIRTILPRYRCAEVNEDSLLNIVKKNKSKAFPLSQINLKSFFDRKRAHVKFIDGLLSSSQNATFLSDDDFRVIFSDPNCEVIYCYVINVLGRSDPFLEKMNDCICSSTVTDYSNDHTTTPSVLDNTFIATMRQQKIIFNDIAEDSQNKEGIKCVITNSIEEEHLLSLSNHIIMYDNQRKAHAVHISRPGQPTAENIQSTSLFLRWKNPQYNSDDISDYRIWCCQVSEPVHIWKNFLVEMSSVHGDGSESGANIYNLKPDSSYIFQVEPQCKKAHYVGLKSVSSEKIDTKHMPSTAGQPTKLRITNATQNSATISWKPPKHGSQIITHYTVLYSRVTDNSKELPHTSEQPKCVLENLAPKQKYEIKVRPESKNGPGTCSESSTFETKPSLAQNLASKSSCVETLNGMKIYVPPMTSTGDRIWNVGKSDKLKPDERVLMIVGATGVGKTTLINGIANYIFGVRWNDTFRFKLIHNEGSKSQAHSQTDMITSYSFHPMEGANITYTLTLIDTPGFGDTRGITRDKEIVQQIRELFTTKGKVIDQLHGIGFVTRAPDARLTTTQRYIFDSILSLFSKNIAKIIFIMTTFSDGQIPPVLTSLEEAKIPYRTSFKFNNSALYAEPVSASIDEMFWGLGMKSFCDFFADFEKTEPESLSLTKEVLEERQQLQTLVQGLQVSIKDGINKIDEIHQEEQVMKDHEADIARNKDFVYHVTVQKHKKVPLPCGMYVTNCLQCNRTCHLDCKIPNDGDKFNCWAMENRGNERLAYCNVCPRKCHWNEHVNNQYHFEEYEEEEQRTSDTLKEKYDVAQKGRSEVKGMIETLKEDLDRLQIYVLEHIERARKCLERLREIALKPDPLTEIEYIDLLIESEKQEGKPGYLKRVNAFQAIRAQAIILKDVAKPKSMQTRTDEAWYERVWRQFLCTTVTNRASDFDSSSLEYEGGFFY